MTCMALLIGGVGAANTKIQDAIAKRTTIRTNFVELRSLRQSLRSKVLEVRSLLNSYKALDTLTEEQIANAQAKVDVLKEARDILKEEYNKIVTNIKEYQDDKSEEKLTGLDRVIASQSGRINALKDAIAVFQ